MADAPFAEAASLSFQYGKFVSKTNVMIGTLYSVSCRRSERLVECSRYTMTWI